MGAVKIRRVAQAATRITESGIYHVRVDNEYIISVGKYGVPKLALKLTVLNGKNQFVPFSLWLSVPQLNSKNKLIIDPDTQLPLVDRCRTFGEDDEDGEPYSGTSQLVKLTTTVGILLGLDPTSEPAIAFESDDDLRIARRSDLTDKELKSLVGDEIFLDDLRGCECLAIAKPNDDGYIEAVRLHRIGEIEPDHDVVK